VNVDYPVWTGHEWISMPIPTMDGEGLMVPNIAAIVYRDGPGDELLLQRRDKPGEVVRGRLEVPGGRWRAGESALFAVRREVAEETGVVVSALISAATPHEFPAGVTVEASRPAVVVSGLHGAYPALLVAFECTGHGDPRPRPGESAEPRWWPVDEVRSHLVAAAEDFVWQSHTILSEVLGA